MPESRIAVIEEWVQKGLQPDLTLIFDLDPALARNRRQPARTPDRFESEQNAFFERVRQAYLQRATRFPERYRVVDASKSPKQINLLLEELISYIWK